MPFNFCSCFRNAKSNQAVHDTSVRPIPWLKAISGFFLKTPFNTPTSRLVLSNDCSLGKD